MLWRRPAQVQQMHPGTIQFPTIGHTGSRRLCPSLPDPLCCPTPRSTWLPDLDDDLPNQNNHNVTGLSAQRLHCVTLIALGCPVSLAAAPIFGARVKAIGHTMLSYRDGEHDWLPSPPHRCVFRVRRWDAMQRLEL